LGGVFKFFVGKVYKDDFISFFMANRKLIKYAVALDRREESARRAGELGENDTINYQCKLAEGREDYAKSKSGIRNIGCSGVTVGSCLISLVGASAGAFFGAVGGMALIGSGEESSGLLTLAFFGVGGGTAGFVGGGILAGSLSFGKWNYNEMIAEKIRNERIRRIKERGRSVCL